MPQPSGNFVRVTSLEGELIADFHGKLADAWYNANVFCATVLKAQTINN